MYPTNLASRQISALLCVFFSFSILNSQLYAQCPQLLPTATLVSPDCQVGTTICDLCPGDSIRLTPKGNKLPIGGCVDWYYGTTNNFNPYNGQGTYLGCSEISTTPPNSCNPCPTTVALFVDACGTEENNEFIAMWSGGGFYVNDLIVDFDAAANVGGGNEDIGAGCGWQTPSAYAISSVQADCPNAAVVGVGPGQSVPPGVPVLIYTSAAMDQNYAFGALCNISGVVYVLQNGCTRTDDAFPNAGSTGNITTNISLACGCSQSLTYNTAALTPAQDGDFFSILPPFTGNAGCGLPPFASGPAGSPPVVINPFSTIVTPDMCNKGPYWAVGIVNPQTPGCPPTFTNYLPFNVPCPMPQLTTIEICANSGPFDMEQLQDPTVPNGVWSGPSLSGTMFNPSGYSGLVEFTFTPDSDCGFEATTTINVLDEPKATLAPVLPICAGGMVTPQISFTGKGPWAFDLLVNDSLIGNYSTSDNPFTAPAVKINKLSIIKLNNFSDAFCNGTSNSVTVATSQQGAATLALISNGNICANQSVTFKLSTSGGQPPFIYNIGANGLLKTSYSTAKNPDTLNLSFKETATVNLLSAVANGCNSSLSGTAKIAVGNPPVGTLTPGIGTLCSGDTAKLPVLFTGTGPYTFVYSIDSINQPPVTTSDTLYYLTVTNITGKQVYTLVSVSGNGCTGTASGSYTLFGIPKPTGNISLIGPELICTPGGKASFKVEINGGIPTYQFSYTVNGQPFTSNISSDSIIVFSDSFLVNSQIILTEVRAAGCSAEGKDTLQLNVLSQIPAGFLQNGVTLLCKGDTANLNLKFTGPAPYTYTLAINNIDIFTDTVTIDSIGIPVSPVSGINVYSLTSVKHLGCEGSKEGAFNVFVQERPVGILGTSTDVCSADSIYLPVALTGVLPYTLSYTINNVLQPPVTSNATDYLLAVPAKDTATVKLVGLSDKFCTGTASGEATVIPRQPLSAVISGGGEICKGGAKGDTVVVSFTGDGPYTFVYSAKEGNMPPVFTTITTSQNPYYIFVKPSNGTFYELDTLYNPICGGTVSGLVTVFVFTPPTAELTGDQTFCDSANTVLNIDFTGTGPFVYVLEQDGVAFPADSTFDDPLIIPVNTKKTTSFKLLSVESPGCVGAPEGGATIVINNKPGVDKEVLNCDPTAGTYTVSFNVSGASLPLTLVQGTGTFTDSSFISAPIAQSQDYEFVFNDANKCGNLTVSGSSTCNCLTAVGNLDIIPDTSCIDGQVQATYSQTGESKDGNDILRFVLHTNPGAPIGTVLGWSTTPVFNYVAGMQAGITYYISAVVGNPGANNAVDLNDACVSISAGAPVVFVNPPSAALAVLDTTVCAGQPVSTTVSATGSLPIKFTYSLNNITQPPVTLSAGNIFPLSLPADVPFSINLLSISDRFCTAGSVSGTVMVDLHPFLQLSAPVATCSPDVTSYTLTFNVIQGSGPYTVTGLTGSFTGNQFISAPLPAGSSYNFSVQDVYACNQPGFTGTVNCNCAAAAGTMSNQPVEVCISQPVSVPAMTGGKLDTDDVIRYALHTAPGATLGTVLAWSTTPSFSFTTGMQAGITYYISGVIGNAGPNNSIIITDPCLATAPGTPVVWMPLPTAVLNTAMLDGCPGDTAFVTVNLTGKAPFQLSYKVGNPTFTTPVFQNTYTLAAVLQQNTTIQLTAVSDALCSGQASGQVDLKVHQPPVISNVTTLCSADNENYTVSFTVTSGGQPPAPGELAILGTTGGQLDTLTGTFTSNSIPTSLPYLFRALDIKWLCGADTVSGEALCSCVTKAGTLNNTAFQLCYGEKLTFPPAAASVLDGNDILLYALTTTKDKASWTVLATSAQPEFVFPAGLVQAGVEYYVVALAGNPSAGGGLAMDDPCLSMAVGPSVKWRPEVTALLEGDLTICKGDTTELVVNFTGDGPYTFTYVEGTGAPVSVTAAASPFVFNVSPDKSVQYDLLNVSGAGNCAGQVDGTALVTLAQPPSGMMQGDTTLCTGGNTLIRIDFKGNPPFTFQYSRNGQPLPPFTSLVSPYLIQVNNVQQSQTYTLLTLTDDACQGTVSGTATIKLNPTPTAELTGAKPLCLGDSLQLTLQLSGADTFNLVLLGNPQPLTLINRENGQTVWVNPAGTTTYSLINVVPKGNKCPIKLGPPVQVQVSELKLNSVLSNFNGYNTSCAESSDGSISLTPVSPNLPAAALWNTGQTALDLSGLQAGRYTVTVTDAIGCVRQDSFFLASPPEILLEAEAVKPTCYDKSDGMLRLVKLSGGFPPFQYALNDSVSIPLPALPFEIKPLLTGTYKLVVEDSYGCLASDTLELEPQDELLVNLGPDTTLLLGDSLLMQALANRKVQLVSWSPIELFAQPDSVQNWVRPLQSTRFQVIVRDTNGCTAEDERTVLIEKTGRVYVPNIFRIGALNTGNDLFSIATGPEVSRLTALRIYDRWGECIYSARDLPLNTPGAGWNGRWRNEDVLPGVYIYVLEVEYVDGSTERIEGDLTVLR